jgi:hypothetical protein
MFISRMVQQDELKLHIRIHSRYQIFDQSGRLPFSIVFGLSRRSPQDTDTRSLILDTSASIFDVPYALANRLLKFFEGQEEKEIDLSSFDAEAGRHQYVVLPPPVRRAAHWNEDFEIFLYEIVIKSELENLLKPDTKYLIRLGNRDLGVQWWIYGEPGQIPPGVILSSESVSEAAKFSQWQRLCGQSGFYNQ